MSAPIDVTAESVAASNAEVVAKTKTKPRSKLERARERYLKEVQGIPLKAAKKLRVVAAPRLSDLKESTVPEADGAPTSLAIPIQEMTFKQYQDDIRRGARLGGFRRYLESVDIENLKFALAKNDSEKALDFLCAMVDPENAGLDIAVIAQRQRISLNDVMAIWRNDHLTETMTILALAAPKVAEDTAIAAQSQLICCTRCDGGGEIYVTRHTGPLWIECPNCRGKGTIKRHGDHKARELVLKATGIIKGAEGPGTRITINTGNHGAESVIDELERLPAITVRGTPIDNES